MRIFDSGSVLMRTYLHLSYALSMTMLALIARQTVDVVYGYADSLNLLSSSASLLERCWCPQCCICICRR